LNRSIAASVAAVKVEEVPVGVAEQDRTIAPWHRRRLLDPFANEGRQACVLGIDVVDAEFDDDAVVVSGMGRTGPEEIHGLGVADSQGAEGRTSSANVGAGRSAETPVTCS
jgi:hypothetical protein